MDSVKELAVSLLTNSEFGYDPQKHQIRLTTLIEFIEDWGSLGVEIETSKNYNQPNNKKKLSAWIRLGSDALSKQIIWAVIKKTEDELEVTKTVKKVVLGINGKFLQANKIKGHVKDKYNYKWVELNEATVFEEVYSIQNESNFPSNKVIKYLDVEEVTTIVLVK